MKNYIVLFSTFLISITALGQSTQVVGDTISFRNDLGLIILSLSFNNVEKEFAFDTGATKSVAFSWVEQELERTSKRIKVRSSNDSRTKMRFYKSGKIVLGSKEIIDHKILKVDDSPIFSCHGIDGILGVDITQHFNWEIDYKNNYLVMYEKNYFPDYNDEMSELDFTFKNNRPFVQCDINGDNVNFLLDTGASDSDLDRRNYSIPNIDEIPNSSVFTGFYDVNGDLTQHEVETIQIPKMTSGSVTMLPVFDYANTSSKLGNQLWEDKILFVSLSTQQLLVSQAKLKETSLEYSCGLVFYKSKLQIGKIHKNGAAWSQGVRQGDIVLKVNGMEFVDFCSFDTYQREYLKTGKDFTILLKNGTKITVQKEAVLATH